MGGWSRMCKRNTLCSDGLGYRSLGSTTFLFLREVSGGTLRPWRESAPSSVYATTKKGLLRDFSTCICVISRSYM